jgi:hypothetical protein
MFSAFAWGARNAIFLFFGKAPFLDDDRLRRQSASTRLAPETTRMSAGDSSQFVSGGSRFM